MLKRSESKQMKMSFVTLEELMPQEHFLRDLDKFEMQIQVTPLMVRL